MSDKSIYSLNSKENIQRDTIPCRIEFIKGLLKGKNLESLVDFDNTDTEFFLPNAKDENESGQSYDTSIVLKKRQLNFADTVAQIGGQLQYIKSGTTGHTFKGEAKDEFGILEYGVKVVAYPKKERYGNINDTRRPENAELMMIKLLSYFIAKKQTPHIVLPIGTFNTDIETFVNLISTNVVSKDNEKYAEFIERYKKKEYHSTVSILISEWANRGDLLDFVRKHHSGFTAAHWKSIFFQVLSVLAVIQSKYPSFRHNDLKANNLLVQKITSQREYFSYKVARCDYKVKNIGYQIKMWDFDFACIPGIVDNKKVESEWTKAINVTPVQNRYYDVHYFFNTLIKRGFCPEVMTSENVPQEVKDFINRIVPKKYQKTGTEFVGKKGRILINDEYLTADDILKYDPYFEEYRVKKIVNSTQQTLNNKLNTQLNTQPNQRFLEVPKHTNKREPEQLIGGSRSNTLNVSSAIPDLTKFLKDSSDTSDEKIKKYNKNKSTMQSKSKQPSKELKKNNKQGSSKQNSQDKLNLLIKESINKKIKTKPSKSTNLKNTKQSTKTRGKSKSRVRTISEEVRELDPDILLNTESS